jgi:4-aminobutyrate aminotransferase-like enzyme
LIVLGAGERAIRFCPALVVNPEEIAVGLEILDESLRAA